MGTVRVLVAFFGAISPSSASQDRAIWATAFYAGLRRGELCGLFLSDIDLDGRTITVRRSWEIRERGHEFGGLLACGDGFSLSGPWGRGEAPAFSLWDVQSRTRVIAINSRLTA